MKRIKAVILFLLFSSFFLYQSSHAQVKSKRDSVLLHNTLSEVVVSAFEQTKKLEDQPAAISYISSNAFHRYNSTGIVSAMNSVAGVRMEQRSPGSYRLNIRGSSLRSPFGVRNVKIYYDGMPFTDPGGNTYLNQLSFSDFGSVEIIKGPSGSLYGASIGGVVIIKSDLFSDTTQQNQILLNTGMGSFGLRKWNASLRWGKNENRNELRYSDLKSDGYRDHTAMRHRTASYETSLKAKNGQKLDAFFHYTDLYYQTPGALTKEQFNKTPRDARPASGIYPSSEENKAAVHQKAFFAGLKHTYQFTSGFKNTTVLYGSYTDFINPTVRNYELRKEPHFGGRTVFQYQHDGEKVQSRYWLGGEFQQGFFNQQDFQNKEGQPDTLMTTDRINEITSLLFAQAEWVFSKGWDLDAGISLNRRKFNFKRLYPAPVASFHKKYQNVLAPRIALSKKVANGKLLYLNVSKGFSPPTGAEVLPSTLILNKKLQAEQGISYELGSKGHLFKNKLYYDISTFFFRLTQSISLRRDRSGADYFVNAGGASQEGLEASFTYAAYLNDYTFFNNINAWLSQTIFNFKYKKYSSDNKNYTGNNFPGTAPYTLAAGMNIETRMGLEAHFTWQYTSKIPLNDANSVYASAYNLLGIRLSYHKKINQRIAFIFSAGGDNLLNDKYSLGDDLNAFGGRYYNVAPAVNFYGNISIKYDLK